MIKLTLSLFFIAALSSVANAQSGWYPFTCPISRNDCDVVNDSLLGVLSPTSTAITNDAGKHWTIYSSVPNQSRQRLRSIKVTSPAVFHLYGWSQEANTPNYYSDVTATTLDSGQTWDYSRSGYRIDGGLQIFQRSTRNWFMGVWNIQNIDSYGAYGVRDGLTGNSIGISGEATCRIDRHDSVVMGISSVGQHHLYVSRNFGSGFTQMPYYFHMHEEAGNPEEPVVQAALNGRWLMSDDSILLASVDTGQTWVPFQHFESRILDFKLLDSVGYLVLKNLDYIEKTTDGGVSWFPQTCLLAVESIIPTSKYVAYGGRNPGSINGGGIWATTTDGGGPKGPVVSIPRIIAFDTVERGQIDSQTVTFSNVSSDSVIIFDLHSDSTNVTIVPSHFGISPFGRRVVTIYYSPRNAEGDDILVHLVSNCFPSMQTFHVTGQMRPGYIGYDQPVIDIGQVRIGETQTKKVIVTNALRKGIALLSIEGNNPHFTVVAIDTTPPGTQRLLPFRFTPTALGADSAVFVIRTDEPATYHVLVRGTGMSDPLAVHRQWIIDRDSIPSIATNVVAEGNGVIAIESERHSDRTTELVSRSITDGVVTGSFHIQSSTDTADGSPMAAKGVNTGFQLTYIDHARQHEVEMIHFGKDGNVTWRDTLQHGANSSTPGAIACDRRGRTAVIANGFGDGSSELGQVLYAIVDSGGHVLGDYLLNGPSRYIYLKLNFLQNGPDWGHGLVGSDSSFFLSLQLDHGTGDYNSYAYDFYSETQRRDSAEAVVVRSEQNRNPSPVLGYANGILYEAGRTDRGFYCTELDNSLHVLHSTGVGENSGIDGISAIQCDTTTQSAYLSGTMSTNTSGHDAVLFRVGSNGNVMWERTFNGLGDAEDIPVKLAVDQAFVYQLIRSADTAGNDWILLKYDSTGQLLYRLRVVGAGKGDNLPRDLAFGSDHSIYIAGSTTNPGGVQQFTVVKYADSARASVSQLAASSEGRLHIRISDNPWDVSSSITIQGAGDAGIEIKIYDVLGRYSLNYATKASTIALTRTQFPIGFYTLQVQDLLSHETKFLKFVRQ